MNIFVLSEDPTEAAQMQCDKHVVKMVVESAQILSTVCHGVGLAGPLQPTHPHHPSVLWAGASLANYTWLLTHFQALLQTYSQRYGKVHRYAALVDWFTANLPPLSDQGLTPFAQVMPEQYRIDGDAVTAYRHYYLGEKMGFAKWRHGPTPGWVPQTSAAMT